MSNVKPVFENGDRVYCPIVKRKYTVLHSGPTIGGFITVFNDAGSPVAKHLDLLKLVLTVRDGVVITG